MKFAAGVLALALMTGTATAADLTLERVYAAPDLTGPRARGVALSPDGTLVTYLRARPDNPRVTDLWAADVAGGPPRRLIDAAALGPDRTARTAAIAGLVAAGARGLAVTWPSPEPEDIEAALAAGAVKVIAKPISAARLTEALKTLLPESA